MSTVFHKMVWTTVKGESKSADDVKKIVASMTAPSVLWSTARRRLPYNSTWESSSGTRWWIC